LKKELISIIVPIYNVEKYLSECIESLINQTYKNIEIILVDDGSQDNCGKICDEYAKKDNRIIVIHKKNGGLSDARNKGIEIAKGEYLIFVDSDDFVSNRFVEKLYQMILENNCEIAICDYLQFENEIPKDENIQVEVEILSNIEVLDRVYDENVKMIIACNKLYKKELFNTIRYPYGKVNEDQFTTYKIIYKANKIAISNEKLYYYRFNSNSIMGSKFNEKRLHILEALEERMQFYKGKSLDELYKKTEISYLDTIITLYTLVRQNISNSSKIHQKLVKDFKSSYKKMKNNELIDRIRRRKYIVFYFSHNLFYFVLKLKGY